ncbi:MAG: hypothetical protein JW734_09705 [Candidatus Omnitrophica bacterium]|nr:hypothetical protein [Candidatus Omnitrophota bacterium]
MQKSKTPFKKKITPLGIKIICLMLIIPFTYLFTFYITSLKTLNYSDNKKIEILQLDKYKELGINSIKELDLFFGQQVKKATPRILVVSIILLSLVSGLLRLKKWAWIAVILYSLFAIAWNIICLFPQASVVRISKLPALIISIIIIYYLTRPGVKRQFLEKKAIN